jgi:predicted DNA-binding transcriptional regulator AlpA
MSTATDDLWTTEHIATFLGLTRKHVTDRLVARPDFPKPEINNSSRNRKWLSEKVRQWARKGT